MYAFMKIRLQILLLFVAIPLLSSSGEGDPTPLSDFNKDFPTAEKIEFKYFNKYNFQPNVRSRASFADESTLWLMVEAEKRIGLCFDLKTGKELGVIAYKGEGLNQFLGLGKVIFEGDSIQLYSSMREIKTFAKKDIIENKPLEKRKFSYRLAPDKMRVGTLHKLPNGSILTTLISRGRTFDSGIGGTYNQDDIPRPLVPGVDSEFNKKSVAIFNSHKANSYETIDYDRFCYSTIKEYNVLQKDKIEEIKGVYAYSHIGTKGNKAVFVTRSHPILYTFDLNRGKVIKEKIYSNIILQDTDKNDGRPRFRTHSIKCNDKYIICIVDGYLSKENVKNRIWDDTAILVYDWDLNPVKRINLDSRKSAFRYFISEDCSTVYLWEETDKGISLSKADLNL